MNITILCSSADHPVNSWLDNWIMKHRGQHDIRLAREASDLQGGDILFLVSCNAVINAGNRAKYRKTLVIHASDLPEGRGWSPHIWQILEGKTSITVSLLEADDQVDAGDIWRKEKITIPRHALYDEINSALFDVEIRLMDFAVEHFDTIKPQQQDKHIEPSYYKKRSPEDSEVDPDKSISSQFDLLRVCDPARFPAFFRLHGHTYHITLEKHDDEKNTDQ